MCPLWGAAAYFDTFFFFVPFQSMRPVQGAITFNRVGQLSCHHFNLCAPYWAQTPRPQNRSFVMYFNICAPCGAQFRMKRYLLHKNYFNLCAPCGAQNLTLYAAQIGPVFQYMRPKGAQSDTLRSTTCTISVSIYAPLKGRSCRLATPIVPFMEFQYMRP